MGICFGLICNTLPSLLPVFSRSIDLRLIGERFLSSTMAPHIQVVTPSTFIACHAVRGLSSVFNLDCHGGYVVVVYSSFSLHRSTLGIAKRVDWRSFGI